MFRVIYESEVKSGLGPLEISQLVANASAHNSQNNISSFLMRVNGSFLQVLEGSPREVSNLVDRIWEDPRHTNMQILASTHDNDSNRHSHNHPLTYIDLRQIEDYDEELFPHVYNSWQSMRLQSSAVDEFLSRHEEELNKLNQD